jgi:hypothetical protein
MSTKALLLLLVLAVASAQVLIRDENGRVPIEVAIEPPPMPSTPHTFAHHAECAESVQPLDTSWPYRFVYDYERQTYGCNPWETPAHFDLHRLKRAFDNGTAFTCKWHGWLAEMPFTRVWWCAVDGDKSNNGFQAFITCPRVPGSAKDVFMRDCVVEWMGAPVYPEWFFVWMLFIFIGVVFYGGAAALYVAYHTWRRKYDMEKSKTK